MKTAVFRSRDFTELLSGLPSVVASVSGLSDGKCGEIVRYVLDKKQNFGCPSNCADRAQNLPGPAHNSVLRVLQISEL